MKNDPLVQSTHQTIVSITFAASLPVLVVSIQRYYSSIVAIVTAALTLMVVACIYWWYMRLGSIYPSHSICSFVADFAIGGGLCLMAGSIHLPLLWTCAWGWVALFAALKATFGAQPANPVYQPFVLWARGVCWGTVLLAVYAIIVLCLDPGLTGHTPSIRTRVPMVFWVVTWIPVIGGIAITLYCDRRWPKEAQPLREPPKAAMASRKGGSVTPRRKGTETRSKDS